jgi:serine/threonine protein kinase
MDTYQYKYGDRPLEGYTIQRAAGRGGFGEVYYAISDSGRQVALKAVQTYEQIELRGISQCMNLKSPHLVTIFDVKYNDKGRPFVIMEYVSGPSLADLLKESPGGLGTQKAAFFLREIGKGLSYLHECGIVHRDLKPGNIFYENGIVKIGDYGLTKVISDGLHVSQTIMVGTVKYMAPEVGKGQYGHAVDIYSLGVVLYEMLTGQVPFLGSSPTEILMRHMTATPDVTNIEEPFARVILCALAKDPGERYQAVQAMIEDVFDVEYIRNDVSQFSPEELTIVAERVAQKIQNAQPPIPGHQNNIDATDEEASVAYSLPALPVLSERDVVGIINSWSERTRVLGVFKYLSPLFAYCDLTGVDEILFLRLILKGLCEDRKLTYDKKPYSAKSLTDVEPFDDNVWSVQLKGPDEFVDLTQDWVSAHPNAVEDCTDCLGAGHVRCDDCSGTGAIATPCADCAGKGRIAHRKRIVCPACRGNPVEHKRIDRWGDWVAGCGTCDDKGVIFEGYDLCLVCQGDPYSHQRKNRWGDWVTGCSACDDRGTIGKADVQWRKCSKCAGTGCKKRKCQSCQGKGTQPCSNCAGSGKLASYARVTACFKTREKGLQFPGLQVSPDLHPSEWIPVWSGTAIDAIPPALLKLHPNVKRDVELAAEGLKTDESSRMLRFEVSLFISPIAACRLRYHTRDFGVIIHATSRRILAFNWAPKNLRHAGALCFGLPVMALALVALPMSHSTHSVMVCVTGLLLSGVFTLWALLSKPRVKKGGQLGPS